MIEAQKTYKRPIMVHQVTEDILQKIKHLHQNNTIVFDDGLFSQYLYRYEYLKFREVWFAISSNIIRPLDVSPIEKIRCDVAHKNVFLNKDYSSYMSLNEIKELISMGYKIAVHGFNHIKIEDINDFKIRINVFKTEYEEGWKAFLNFGLNLPYKAYCYPYNYKPVCGDSLLKSNGYDRIFGDERIDIEELL